MNHSFHESWERGFLPNAASVRSDSTTAVPDDLIQRVLREFNEPATTDEIRQLQESGGLALADFYAELEHLLRPHG